ncbi:sensory rhodopsin transducer [Autumnicola psychrophila]|uniref:Sensory rhodopsin transducer n=1 Tax=Autumnicola psychrophila TaxID=3075592 RepID=A0ABU3DRF6_9FLAO|nr:sensory rhodopsin transducer [Zunongwangia sp. F225]MDT0685677.1 sensory rhodopsin transducer [Zunongwangia sp. F225]
MKAIGKIDWAFSAGRIPFKNNGEEPEFISHDKIAVLNISEENAIVELLLFYEDQKPVGTYEIIVEAKRLRKIRFNDIIDPEAMQLERNYSCFIKTSTPVVIQFSRMNTGAKANAEMSTIAFPVEPEN